MTESKQQTRILLTLAVAVLSALLLASCWGARKVDPHAGSVSARVIWPQAQSLPAGASMPFDTPVGVAEVRATMSGSDFTPIQVVFTATVGTPGSGTITNIPAGINRTLLLEGLNGTGTPVYIGQVIGIAIMAGQQTDVVVPMSLVSSIPPATPAITSPASSPHYTNGTSLTLSGACQSTDPHTVTLSGDQAGSQACAADAYSFALTAPGQGTYLYSVVQTDDTTLLTSPAANLIWVVDTSAPPPVTFISPSTNPVETSGSSLLITGACETGSTVGVTGASTQSTSCIDGAFSITVAASVDGTYDYTIMQTDTAGNPSTTSILQWIRNSSAPPPPVLTSPIVTPYYSAADLTSISGTCVTGLTVNMSGADTGSVACSGGTFSFAPAGPFADGVHSFVITQQGAGLPSGDVTLTWVRDNSAPGLPSVTTPASSPVTTSGTTLLISGTCEANATVSISGDSSVTAPCLGGLYSFALTKTADGTYTFDIRQTDLAGNTSGTVQVQWIRDNAPPVAPSISSPAGDPVYSNAAINLTGACTSASPHTVYLTGAATDQVACSAGSYSFLVALPAGGDGPYTLNLRQGRDATGASSSTVSRGWVVDTVAPAAVSTVSPSATQTISSGSTFTISGTCTTGESVRLTGDDTQSTACTSGAFSFTINKSTDATYNFSVTQQDLAGNTSPAVTRQWVRDTGVPATPGISTPAASPHYSNTLLASLQGTCDSALPHTVNLSGAQSGSVACSGGTFSFAVSDPGVDGTYVYNVTQTLDGTGATSGAATMTWVYDTQAPAVVTITTPATTPITTPGNSITISGGCETNATVNLSGDASQSTSCVASAYSFTIPQTVDSTYSFLVDQTDQAGNTSPAPAGQVWIRDTQVPGPPTITGPASNPYVSNNTSVTLSGGCIGTGYTVNLTGQQVLSMACSGAGTYSFSLTDPGVDGTYNYTVTQTRDVNGLSSSGVGFTWTRDTAPPAVVTITTPASSPVLFAGNSIVISGGCVTGLTVNLDGDDTQSTTCASSAYAFTVTKTTDGLYSFSLTQQDAAGNTSTPVVQEWSRGTPMFTVTPTFLSMGEGQAPQTFSVSINMPPNGDVVVDVVSTDITEATVDKASLTFNSGTWSTAQEVTVTPEADGVADGNQVASIVLMVNGGSTTDTTGYASLDPANVSVSVLDSTVPGITVTPQSGLTTTETGGTATFSVVLNKAPNNNVVLDVTSLDIGEVSVDKSTLTFTTGDWSTPQVVTVTGQDDALVDGNQTVTVSVSVNAGSTTDTTGYAALDPPDVTATNMDNDAVTVTVTPTSGLAVSESGTTATFSVVLNTLPDGDVTISVTSLDTSEVSVDKSTLTFTTSDWFTPQVVTLTGLDDGLADGNQPVTVALAIVGASTTDTTGYAALNPADVQVTNSDNDAAGVTVISNGSVTTEGGLKTTFTVRLNTQPATSTTVAIDIVSQDITEATVDRASVSFTELDWQTPQTVTVAGVDDLTVDGNQSVVIALTINAPGTTDTTGYALLNPPDVTILNMDDDVAGVTVIPTSLTTTEDGGSDTFTVRLNTQPAAGQSVVILVQNGDASEVTVDKSTLTITDADWQTPQTVTVSGIADGLSDGNQLVNVALITDTLLTTDSVYDSVDPSDVSVTNLDNTPSVTVSPTGGLSTSELGGTASFTVVLNAAPAVSSQVLIDVVSGDTNEVTVDKSLLTFDEFNWTTPQTVTLTGVDDALSDGSQLVTVALTMNGGTTDAGYAVLDPADVTVTNSDNEVIEVVVTPTSGLVTTESGGSASFTVSLSSLPNGDVAVDVVSSNTAEATVDKSLLTFTTADWETAQTVVVKGVNDTLTDGDVALTVQLTINGGATTDTTGYAGLNPPDVSVTNWDNEPLSEGTAGAPLDLTGTTPYGGSATSTAPSYYYVSELAANTQYFVTLSSLVNPATFQAYSDSALTALECTGNQNSGDSRPKSCYAMSNGSGELFIVVSTGSALGSTYKIDVMLPPANEGTAVSPIDLTGLLPYPDGQVGAASSSYYVVTGLTPAASKYVRLTNLTQNIDLFVYSDSGFSVQLCSSTASTIAEACVATVPGSGNLYIRSQNVSGQPGATYTVGVIDPPVAEGSVGSPVDVTGLLPYGGTMVSPGSFYVITGLTPGTQYTVSMTEMTSGGSLRVYSDATFSTLECSRNGAVNLPESCQANANASGKLYVNADTAGLTGAGATTYNIRVQ